MVLRPRRLLLVVGVILLGVLLWAFRIVMEPIVDYFPPAPPDSVELRAGPLPTLEFVAAFRTLDSVLSPAQRDTLRRTLPESAATYHSTVGRFIRNELLRPPRGAALVRYFEAAGLRHPDEMSDVLLQTYGDYLREHALDVTGAIHRVLPPPTDPQVHPDSSGPALRRS